MHCMYSRVIFHKVGRVDIVDFGHFSFAFCPVFTLFDFVERKQNEKDIGAEVILSFCRLFLLLYPFD